MPKAILILLGFVAIGVGVLHYREQSLAIRNQTARVHREIQESQATLWRQQVQIAEFTSPRSIAPAPIDSKVKGDKDVAGARE